MFNGQDNQGNSDFVSFGLKFGHPEFRFKLGGGVAKVQSDIPVQPGRWHTVTLWRNRKNASMVLDDNPPVYGSAKGIFQGLDLVESLFVGGLPSYENINEDVGFTRGFVGCISRIALGPRHRSVSGDIELFITLVPKLYNKVSLFVSFHTLGIIWEK